MTTLDDSDILRVVNRGDTTLRVMYDSKETRLDPGVDNFLPFAAVALWFGDPRSSSSIGSVVSERGLRTYIPDRETEVRRLRVKYDNQLGDETIILKHPLVDVYTLQGEPVTTVLDDPRGDTVMAATTTVTDQSNMMALIAKQQQAIEALTAMVMGQQNSDVEATGQGGPASETPPEVPPASVPETPPPPPPPVPEPTAEQPPAPTIPPPTPPPAPANEGNAGTQMGNGGSTPLILPTTPQSGNDLPPVDQS